MRRYLVAVDVRGGGDLAQKLVKQSMGVFHNTQQIHCRGETGQLPSGLYLVSTDIETPDLVRSCMVAGRRTGMPFSVMAAHVGEVCVMNEDPQVNQGPSTKALLARIALIQRPAH